MYASNRFAAMFKTATTADGQFWKTD